MTIRGVVIGIVTFAAALAAPRPASATVYTWNKGGGGEWTVKANWTCDVQSGDCTVGFPHAQGDAASFTLPSTMPREITIKDGVSVTVGTIVLGGSHQVTIIGGNSTLVFDNGGMPAQFLRATSAPLRTGADRLSLPVELRGALWMTVPQGELFSIERTITDDGGGRSITKFGAGEAKFFASISYGGPTIVANGVLRVPAGVGTKLGPLVIGDDSGASLSARVTMEKFEGITDTAPVLVKSDGLLDMFASDRIGDLTLKGGVAAVHDATLAIRSLTTTGVTELRSHGAGHFWLEGDVTVTGSCRIIPVGGTAGTFNLGTTSRTFTVNDTASVGILQIALSIVSIGHAGVIKEGDGDLMLTGAAANTYPGETWVRRGRLVLGGTAVSVPGNLQIGGVPGARAGVQSTGGNIADASTVAIGENGVMSMSSGTDVIGKLMLTAGAQLAIGQHAPAHLSVDTLVIDGSHIQVYPDSTLALRGNLSGGSTATATSIIDGAGIVKGIGERRFDVHQGPREIDLSVNARIDGITILHLAYEGTLELAGDNTYLATSLGAGTLIVRGQQPLTATLVRGGTLRGNGRVEEVLVETGTLAPGFGYFKTAGVRLERQTRFQLELAAYDPTADLIGGNDARQARHATTPFIIRDRLDAKGPVQLNEPTLVLTLGSIGPLTSFTIIDNDGTDPVEGTFADLPEGAALIVGGQPFTISYRGGDGNDVVVSKVVTGPGPGPNQTTTYYLAEGATGSFFDDDVLIANATDTSAPVTLTFLQEGGSTVVEHRTIAPQSRTTVHVDQIAGLEASSASVQVVSDNNVPLIVERSMFWDATYYGGHTANAVAQPELRWIFAEGFQGFFDTYVLIANANATATTATLTFLREGDTPIVKTVPVDAFARKTVYAGDYPELVGRAFGIVVDATQPVIAERSMYFASLPGRLWTGGHVNTGIVAPSTSWFHAEGATGGFFSTFILLSNPQDTAANVELRFLLDTGDVITRQKTIEARQRLTINPATEGDARLENAAVSTVVTSDVPIVSERSMYWPGDASPFGEGHNSSGVVSTATRWGLAEGRIGGPREFVTYILLANPSAQAADVTITYLRESGAPIVKTYTVPATSRFNVDVMSVVPELLDAAGASFGARIDVTNNVPIAVERSLYWNANGVFWAGGTNALATPLPEATTQP